MPNKNRLQKAALEIADRNTERRRALRDAKAAPQKPSLVDAVKRLRAAREALDDVMRLVRERNELLRRNQPQG